MSVLIKDMEKPKSCYAVIDGESEYCPFLNTDDDCVILLKKGICEGTWEEQYSKCPLVEESERLTDDDFETIRIHLNAQKEKLCNQQRWEEAEEYQRIIDRFMAFASAEPEQWETCFDCPLSHGCPVINGCTNEQAMEYAGKIPDNCPLNKKSVELDASDRNVGMWVSSDSQCGIGCPFCGKPVDDFCNSIDYIDLLYEPNFCPNCGAKLKGRK